MKHILFMTSTTLAAVFGLVGCGGSNTQETELSPSGKSMGSCEVKQLLGVNKCIEIMQEGDVRRDNEAEKAEESCKEAGKQPLTETSFQKQGCDTSKAIGYCSYPIEIPHEKEIVRWRSVRVYPEKTPISYAQADCALLTDSVFTTQPPKH
jgi:hypothetical protein